MPLLFLFRRQVALLTAVRTIASGAKPPTERDGWYKQSTQDE